MPLGAHLHAEIPSGWDSPVHVFAATAPRLLGHYAPREHPLVAIEALAMAHGCGHLVLVQPSIYGTDNQLLLTALTQSPAPQSPEPAACSCHLATTRGSVVCIVI
jgi:predicted TIM-barrel fold metal-dependent hydrolase